MRPCHWIAEHRCTNLQVEVGYSRQKVLITMEGFADAKYSSCSFCSVCSVER